MQARSVSMDQISQRFTQSVGDYSFEGFLRRTADKEDDEFYDDV
jgi:hypothetical protein